MHPRSCDPSLLHLHSNHRSTEIWRLGGGDSQRCRRRNPNHTRLPNLHRRMFHLLQSTGFYGIARVSFLQLDWSIIAALVERWIVSHSFLEKTGRTLSVFRVVLDELAPSHFIWMPYSTDVIDTLPPYCLIGRHVWRYRGPMICIFIVEPHMVDRVSRQFGMLQSIPINTNSPSKPQLNIIIVIYRHNPIFHVIWIFTSIFNP
ncbi:hypothetical protein POM88_027252 [Heracleum sosnowskyi]|uniref:Aminotransferase-like plant mobile domain-containing protein n=1 Tax=Heracleum sosnowskyi TaxID=360622 RepID=A0AAD8MQT7_9APIA|nr:hypothetical protein POM88_027252 [Heracleum sosnowskyi]